MFDIRFDIDPRPSATRACRVCGADDSEHRLDVNGQLRLFACRACESFFYDGENPVSGYESGLTDAFWLDYVQAGAGISTMLEPLHALDPFPAGDLIDVGCGFGFVVDYWRFLGNHAIGLEASNYGAIGRDRLGADIRPVYLDAFRSAEPASRFAVVYSSEVIEHTPDPGHFLDQLVDMLDDDAVLVMTTPSTTAIGRDVASAPMIAALSPGFHYLILSQPALERMFSAHGLHFRIETHGFQMVAWASRRPLPGIRERALDWDRYLDYLEMLSANPDPHLSGGALNRLFKDSLNTGRPERAAAAWPQLCKLARESYAIDLERPEIGALMRNTEPLAEPDRYPVWLGTALLFGALHVGHISGDRRTKLRMLDAALAVLARRADVDLQYGQEAQHFLQFAERQYLVALSEALTVSLDPMPPDRLESDLRSSLDVLSSVTARLTADKSGARR